MNRLGRVLNYSLSTSPIDLCLVRLAAWSVGIGVLILVALTLPRRATNEAELTLGLGLAVLNCLVAVMFGILSPHVHSASLAVKMPWHARLWERCGYSVGVAVLTFGMWFTSTLPLTRAGFISAFLLIFATTLATFCVGLLITLSRHEFQSAVLSSRSDNEQ